MKFGKATGVENICVEEISHVCPVGMACQKPIMPDCDDKKDISSHDGGQK